MNINEINNKENKIFNNYFDKEINETIRQLLESNETDIEFINECNKNNSNYNKEKEEFELINIEEDPSFDFLLERNLKLNKEYDNKKSQPMKRVKTEQDEIQDKQFFDLLHGIYYNK